VLEQVLFFGQSPIETTRSINRHTTFGSLYKNDLRANPLYTLPPPEWSMGQYFRLENITNEAEFDTFVNFLQKVGYPIEGFFMDE
jgi:hypothetical protein